MTEEIDKLLKGYFRREQPMRRLDQLENDVWQRIAFAKQEQPVGVLEGLLSFLFPAQHRFAPVMAAALLGIVLGYGTLQIASPTPNAAEALNFKVFKPQAIMLASIR
jgi:hypothetical protein